MTKWLLLEVLQHCQEKLVEYDSDAAAKSRWAVRPLLGPHNGAHPIALTQARAPEPIVAPAGFRLAATPDVLAAALIGKAVLKLWPARDNGCVHYVQGAAGFSHVVLYCSASALVGSGGATAKSLRRSLARTDLSLGAPPSPASD